MVIFVSVNPSLAADCRATGGGRHSDDESAYLLGEKDTAVTTAAVVRDCVKGSREV
jgi:hypothetical protein